MSPTRAEVAAALADAARHGPFFTIGTEPDVRYVPFDAASVEARVAQTAAELEARTGQPVERRVAASLTQLNLAARLVSPALVSAAAAGIVPDLSTLVWRPERPGPCPIALADPTGTTGTDVTPVLRLVEQLPIDLNPAIARGNLASVVASAGRLAPVCADLAASVLASVPDAGSAAPQGFRRRSCCLYYRVSPRAGICEDCVLARPA